MCRNSMITSSSSSSRPVNNIPLYFLWLVHGVRKTELVVAQDWSAEGQAQV